MLSQISELYSKQGHRLLLQWRGRDSGVKTTAQLNRGSCCQKLQRNSPLC